MFRHPAQVCLSYAAHWRLSMRLALVFARAALAAVVHAFAPDLCVASSTAAVVEAQAVLATAGCRNQSPE
jgi:hypothetical protein